jgi:hypothetical protein
MLGSAIFVILAKEDYLMAKWLMYYIFQVQWFLCLLMAG